VNAGYAWQREAQRAERFGDADEAHLIVAALVR
jgi:hypothetical protein